MANNTKTALVLDWSNLLYRSLFMNKLFKNAATYNDQDEVNSFIYKFTTDVCSILKIFSPTKLFIATDAKHSWRKDIDPVNVSYKGNREKDKDINWDNIYAASDELLEIFRKQGACIAYTNNAEADDMMAMIKETTFAECPDYNVIIVSADADIRQLIDFKQETHQYCVVYNTITRGKTGKRLLYCTKEFMEWVTTPDEQASDIFFSNVDFSKKYIKDIINTNNAIEMSETNPHDVVLSKIFCGDDGDNVPAFYEWYKNGKKARVTAKKFEKIQEEVGFDCVNKLCECQILLKPVMERVLKKELDDIDVIARLDRQRRLVELNSEMFPAKISEYKKEIAFMFTTTSSTMWGHLTSTQALNGTKYLRNATKERKSIERSVFKDLDKLVNKNKTIGTEPLAPVDLFDGLF